MKIRHSVSEILSKHVTLEVESIDRMYLNVYVPQLQRELGLVSFLRYHRGYPIPSSAVLQPISEAFIGETKRFVAEHEIPLIPFHKGQRKDDVARDYLAKFEGDEGVLFVGKAQEKAPVFRTQRRRRADTGEPYPWIVRSTAMVNHFYFYCVDQDFGPFFLKFCTYFPYTAKLCINGHEYLKRQLDQRGIVYEALDNGILSCEDPKQLQRLCDGLSAAKINRLLRKWLRLLPHPFSPADRRAGYLYDISILQAEFSLTQVLDAPLTGRLFFEDVIRENLDIGRPDQVQLIFNRRVTKRTPGRFRTRVITQGVIPSLHIDYKHTRVKQYHKEGRALRTETTINNTRDFGIGKRLHNLPELRQVGFTANRRLLDVQKTSCDCALDEAAFERVERPLQLDQQRVSALRFADARVQTLFHALVMMRLFIGGFTNRQLREQLAPLLGLDPSQMTPGKMTYDLRRLRLHGLIERIPHSHRYEVTRFGLRVALFYTRAYARLLRPGIGAVLPDHLDACPSLRKAFDNLEHAMDDWHQKAKRAA
ncbi:MAG: hypothetical protein ACE5F6_14615 [Anaerolineae bacterium]